MNISSGNNLTVPANDHIFMSDLSQGSDGSGGSINLTASTASGSGTLTYNAGTTDNG